MNNRIEAILFDMGGTLRTTTKRTRQERHQILQQMMDLVGAQGAVEEFSHTLSKGAKGYKRWAERTHIELSEGDLWTKWMLPDLPSQQIRGIAVQLNQLYRDATGLRVAFPESREVVLELFRRGYRLGLVSNTTSSVEIPALLKELELTGCFETVILSTVVGKRKPNPTILLDAAQHLGVAPERCVYIGDRVDRDVAAAHKAGFSQSIILREPRHHKPKDDDISDLTPDRLITNLRELLEFFPPRSKPEVSTVSNAALSTMWAIRTLPTLTDFFEFARRAGFSRIELNHRITSAMLEGIDLSQYQVSSIHEPCPADISTNELKKHDWLISSTNEKKRIAGVKAIQRSIDLACQLKASLVVVHAGHVNPDAGPEKQLRALIASGRRDSDKYREIHGQMVQARTESEASFESVKKSILELLAHAEGTGVRLGIENRYHYMEFPSPDELEVLLSLAGPDRIGFLYDSGHAQTLDVLGFYPHEEWLKRFSHRMIGTHLHDVVGTTDHYAPGLGSIDFDMVASYLPEDALRTCEFQTFNTPEQVKAGLKVLIEHGCIKLQH
jgi:HAD superfamily hydrolase (TIGR01549 family)